MAGAGRDVFAPRLTATGILAQVTLFASPVHVVLSALTLALVRRYQRIRRERRPDPIWWTTWALALPANAMAPFLVWVVLGSRWPGLG